MKNKMELDSKKIEEQEHLSDEALQKFKPEFPWHHFCDRPESGLIQLMNWVASKEEFVNYLRPLDDIKILINNKIAMDGPFLQFAKEKELEISCLYQDSIASWKAQEDYENFIGQGIYFIKNGDLGFLLCALFHKGNGGEDEVSFFVVIPSASCQAYFKLRNEYDKWLADRDRDSNYIYVAGGEEVPFPEKTDWDDLFMPDDLKKEIKLSVEGFLNGKSIYKNAKIPWKRGILLYGEPGCHAKGTPIMMQDGSWKNVEDIKVNDCLMGPDSEPREVLKLVRGKENMYQINPNKGKPFIVNENHILHLQHSGASAGCPKECNITVKSYLQLSQCLREKLKLVKSPELRFYPDKFKDSEAYEIDPYILGVWLGGGTTGEPSFTSADTEIIEYIESYAEKNNLNVNKRKDKSKAFTISLSANNGNKNIFTNYLRALGIFDKKAIPDKYLTSDTSTRLQLLAGIIDTDGSYNDVSCRASEKYNKKHLNNKGCFDFVQKDFNLSKQIQFLCYSLGFGCTFKKCTKTIKSNNFSGEYYRVSICGDIFNIPTKLPRKQARKGNANKNYRMIGIKSVEPIGVDDFYGLTVDKDHLYVMDDFWITHNCGKTSLIRTIISNYKFKPVTIQAGLPAYDEALADAFSYAETQGPSLIFLEDMNVMLSQTSISHFLQLMDGLNSKEGLLIIGTANDISQLQSNITDRPSRFDRKWEIPLPTAEMASAYISKSLSGCDISDVEINQIAKQATQKEFSYAHLKELYLSAAFCAISKGKDKPDYTDLKESLSQLVADKKTAKSGFRPSSKKNLDITTDYKKGDS